MTCPHLSPRGCALYLRPCTVKQLWADQVPPPSQCPRRDQFESLDFDDPPPQEAPNLPTNPSLQ